MSEQWALNVETPSSFCIFHVNAPGQEEGAAPLPEGYEYPTMEQLSEQVRPSIQGETYNIKC